ncbi:hypothetical protein MMC09_004834 [Bachmanniomyces sp. S44760]|nr:hypothetical protein [Bachmanniomyces sp. S44760]
MGASSSQRAIVLQSAHPDLLSDRRNANRRISIPSSMTSHGTHVQYHRRDSFGTPHQPTDRQIALQTLPTNHQGMVSPQDPIRIRHNNPQNHPIISPLFPPPGHYLPARPDPKPANIALHQALVQDAKIIIVDPSTSPKPDVKYFQYMKCFAVSPILIRPEDYNISGEFEVPHDFICGTSIDHFDKVSGSATRSIQKGSQTYRLRCIEIGENEKVGESQWCVAETIWPTAICIFLNGKSLEIRRKLQHSSDKPIDFTSLVSSGVNHLQLSLLHPSQPATARSAYLVAIELLELTDSETIKREVQTGEAHVIVEEMCNSSNTNDSDFEVIQGDVIISITDPFTSRLIETPVRGKDCRHFECFDLGIFLATRTGYPCPPEQLRCPICAADARPCSLRVNGWMAGVLQEVKRMGQPEARAIVLLNMGGWRIEDTRKEDLKDARTEDNCNDLRRLGRRISTVNVEKKAIVH